MAGWTLPHFSSTFRSCLVAVFEKFSLSASHSLVLRLAPLSLRAHEQWGTLQTRSETLLHTSPSWARTLCACCSSSRACNASSAPTMSPGSCARAEYPQGTHSTLVLCRRCYTQDTLPSSPGMPCGLQPCRREAGRWHEVVGALGSFPFCIFGNAIQSSVVLYTSQNGIHCEPTDGQAPWVRSIQLGGVCSQAAG